MKIVDGLALPEGIRQLLKPDEAAATASGLSTALPRYFYEFESWEEARGTLLTEHFRATELMVVDCREAAGLTAGPLHYAPCAISIMARYLEEFRRRVDAPVFIAANGGYRSPTHAFEGEPGSHCWGTAANIHRIGDAFLDSAKEIGKYADLARSIGPEVFVKPFGSGAGKTDDHLHLDIGCVNLVPRIQSVQNDTEMAK